MSPVDAVAMAFVESFLMGLTIRMIVLPFRIINSRRKPK